MNAQAVSMSRTEPHLTTNLPRVYTLSNTRNGVAIWDGRFLEVLAGSQGLSGSD